MTAATPLRITRSLYTSSTADQILVQPELLEYQQQRHSNALLQANMRNTVVVCAVPIVEMALCRSSHGNILYDADM